MSNSTHPILNPNTPLAFLPPDIASQFEAYRYIVVATLGAYAWGVLSHLDSLYKLLFQCPFTAPTIAYVVSIVASLTYIICCVVFHTGSVDDCQTLAVVLTAGFAVAVPATSFLFYLRVRAIFSEQRVIVWAFSISWLAVLACCMMLPFAVSGTHIGPTSKCIDSGIRPFSSAGFIASTVFDSLVFIFISWKMLSLKDGIRGKWRAFFKGGGLSSLSKTILQGGQSYYLLMVIGNIATTVVLLDTRVPPVLHASLTTPNMLVMNFMACKVFRDVKFGKIKETVSLPTFLPRTTPTTSHSSDQRSHGSESGQSIGDGRVSFPLAFLRGSADSFSSEKKGGSRTW